MALIFFFQTKRCESAKGAKQIILANSQTSNGYVKIPGAFLCGQVYALCLPMTKLQRKLTCFLPQDLLGFSLAPLFPHSLRKSRSGQDYEAGSGGSPGSNFGSNAGLTNVHHLWKIKSKVLVFPPPLFCFGARDSGVYLKIETLLCSQ